MTLSGRVVLVTGGSHGIGRAIVGRCLDEGAKVAFCGRDASDVRRAVDAFACKDVVGLPADVTDASQVDRLVADVVQCFGAVDVLVNNAGIYGPIGPSWENDPREWQDAVTINLTGTFLMSRRVVPEMIKTSRGKIVNMSGGGAATPFPRFTAYAVSKAAIVRFTETLALEVAPYNIQVNAVAPGFVATRLHEQTLKAGERAGADFYRRTCEQLVEGAVDPAVPAACVAYLASSKGDRITGKFISAVWDKWADFEQHLDDMVKTDVYTLRRIVPADREMTWK